MDCVNKDATRARPWVLGTVVAGLVLVACGIAFPSQETAPPQGWLDSRGPVVPHDSFPGDCSLCHVGEGWNRIADDFHFDHLEETGTPLTGAHSTAECLRCHNDKGPVMLFSQRGCGGCHVDVHSGLLGFNCGDCHGEADWQPNAAIVRHNDGTRFPLIGAHAGVACYRCHEGAHIGNYRRADTRCESCHQEDLAGATNPDHIASGWTQDCQQCHRSTTWGGQGFTHSTFPLTGAHTSVACSKCHVGGVFAGTPRNCVGCHQTDYDNTTNPNHQSSGYSTNCITCHSTSTWQGAVFNHSFPLSGNHNVSCATCHTVPGNNQVFDCLGCHEHNQTKMDDVHSGRSGYVYSSPACVNCHPNGR